MDYELAYYQLSFAIGELLKFIDDYVELSLPLPLAASIIELKSLTRKLEDECLEKEE